ncbi:hypothetical protein CVT24_000859 [Panaeolus cyanescens]|uniref:DNA mismatch repair proteins mutS family domain-containing protein n=1 Tax=Panaeolus cyanescens TaxID=181874 RepID=A0A409VWX8_9AGAR|nr:hypothetical protein CVT24_000859 [Panaeolus cyanescens]
MYVADNDQPRDLEDLKSKATKSNSLLANEIQENLKRFPHCILLTRVGQFYESYFDQAHKVASLLSIKLTSRKWSGGRIAMCGFPLVHLDRHLKTLVDQNKKFVAICEEFPVYDGHGGKHFERRVTRIITPGTLIDESFLNPLDNNFLLTVAVPIGSVIGELGLAWIDVSTGEFFSKHCPLDTLADELARICPREVVLDSSMQLDPSHPVPAILNDYGALISYISRKTDSSPATWLPLRSVDQKHTNEYLVSQDTDAIACVEASAVQLLSQYLSQTLLEHMPKLAQPLHEAAQDCMQIDSHTIQGLEIRENLYERGTRGSLFNVVKRTISNGGTRLLSRWLCAPSTSIIEIERRHTLVSFLQNRPHFCGDIAEMLKQMDDVTRLSQAFLMGRATFADLVSLKSSIQLWNKLKKRFSIKLKTVHKTLKTLEQKRVALEACLQSKFKAPSLTLRSAPSQGHFVHVARAKRDNTLLHESPDFLPIGATLSTKTYIYRPWTELRLKISSTLLALCLAEKEAFESIRNEVIGHITHLRENSYIMDELDVLLSFAKLASELNFVRPKMTNDLSFHVVNGRHPVVEMGLLSNGRQFTPNSIQMNSDSSLHIITGPNMAGKSTFLRQNALISILAQVGSFVPADYARIGIVDKVFSRIGARDDLYRDRSTFMVEMLETGHILNRATDRSLIIMDEVGRGTTVNDGIAIAFGAVHHLATINRSRCLFATHFHELAELVGNVNNIGGSGSFSSVKFYCSDVADTSGQRYSYSYKLKPGINYDSHGLKVARLAGLPQAAMTVAERTLEQLKKQRTPQL